MANGDCEIRINARVFPLGEALGPHPIALKNRQGLPSHGWARLKRQARRKISEERMRVATLNLWTMTGKGRELVDIMKRRKIGVPCVQEARWKGNKARELSEGCNCYYSGANMEGRNGVGMILSKDLKESGVCLCHANWMYRGREGHILGGDGPGAYYNSRKGKDLTQIKQIKDNSIVPAEENAIKRRWETYFEGLLNEENPRTVFEDGLPNEAVTIEMTRKEVNQAVKKMKSSKAAGPDNIPLEV
ncbi:uncharacterized protein [Palaemon carinicauda]|uniref:uncharacterized protein n=1 Tax=Palaemon carinicauda TaxID=392227 RepID=UPI0035B6449C